jgi:hypothetical protein
MVPEVKKFISLLFGCLEVILKSESYLGSSGGYLGVLSKFS